MDATMFHHRKDKLTVETGSGSEDTCYLSIATKADEFTLHTQVGELYELGILIARAAIKMGAEDTQDVLTH